MIIQGTYTTQRNQPNQFDHGIAVLGVDGVTIANVSVAGVDGDFVTVQPDIRQHVSLVAARPSRNVLIDGLMGLHAARQGVSFTGVVGAEVRNSYVSEVQNGIDIEPDAPGEPARHISLLNNRFGALGFTAVASVPGVWPAVGDLVIVGNQMTAASASCYPAIELGADSLLPSPRVKNGYTVRGNTLLSHADGIRLNGIAGGIVIDNIISSRPGAPGGLNCSNVQGVPVRVLGSQVSVVSNQAFGF